MSQLSRYILAFTGLLLLNVVASAQHRYHGQHGRWEMFSGTDSTHVTAVQLQGTWNCIYSVYDGPSNDARDDMGPYHWSIPETAIFEDDTLCEYNYPCEMYGWRMYAIKDDSIYTKGFDGELVGPQLIELKNDTLRIYDGEPFPRGDYHFRCYVRDTVDPAVIALLKKKTVNPDCLIGHWILVTEFDTTYDGNGVVPIDFPFTLPYTLHYTKQSAATKVKNGTTVMLSADGVLRPFYLTFSEDNDELHFTTQDWYKGEWSFTATYVRSK